MEYCAGSGGIGEKMNLSEAKIIAGRRLLDELVRTNAEVAAALWVLFPDIQSWKLGFLISDVEGPREAYKIIQKALSSLGEQMEKPGLDEVILFKREASLLQLLSFVMKTPNNVTISMSLAGNVVNGQLLPDCHIYRLNIERTPARSATASAK